MSRRPLQLKVKVPSPQDLGKDENINSEMLSKNMNQMRNMHTYGAINAGILSGFFGMDGFHGLFFYFIMFALVSICIFIKTEFKIQEYFVHPNEVLFGGIGNDMLLFLMVWVIFHNLVNIL